MKKVQKFYRVTNLDALVLEFDEGSDGYIRSDDKTVKLAWNCIKYLVQECGWRLRMSWTRPQDVVYESPELWEPREAIYRLTTR